MANSNAPMFVQLVQNWPLQIDNAAGTDPQTVLTGGQNGSKVESLIVTSTDSVAHVLAVSLSDGTTSYLLTTVNIPAGAGNSDDSQPVNLLTSSQLAGALPLDQNGNRYLYLKAGYSLQVAAAVAVTADDFVNLVATGADF